MTTSKMEVTLEPDSNTEPTVPDPVVVVVGPPPKLKDGGKIETSKKTSSINSSGM